MARPVKHDGVVYRREGTNFWWMRYRDWDGTLRKESNLPGRRRFLHLSSRIVPDSSTLEAGDSILPISATPDSGGSYIAAHK